LLLATCYLPPIQFAFAQKFWFDIA
jgi:hypothetical protein